uniref:Uncharacterized protein n=1 Tax=Octopus bimaculoides TaxID=37653 RepID=A0A0L8GT13_OCTBM
MMMMMMMMVDDDDDDDDDGEPLSPPQPPPLLLLLLLLLLLPPPSPPPSALISKLIPRLSPTTKIQEPQLYYHCLYNDLYHFLEFHYHHNHYYYQHIANPTPHRFNITNATDTATAIIHYHRCYNHYRYLCHHHYHHYHNQHHKDPPPLKLHRSHRYYPLPPYHHDQYHIETNLIHLKITANKSNIWRPKDNQKSKNILPNR